MDPAEIRFIRQAFINERGAQVLIKPARPSSCESPLKIPRHLVRLFVLRILINNAAMKFIAP